VTVKEVASRRARGGFAGKDWEFKEIEDLRRLEV
jgi:hypothetical protein